MDFLPRFIKARLDPPKEAPVGSYSMRVVSLPEELDWEAYLPLELRFVFKRLPAPNVS